MEPASLLMPHTYNNGYSGAISFSDLIVLLAYDDCCRLTGCNFRVRKTASKDHLQMVCFALLIISFQLYPP